MPLSLPLKGLRGEPHADGRRERSRSSRSKIVGALLDLVGSGTVSPSAAQVAETAGVGLRSVFRHFEDMDALYREMGEIIEARVLPFMMEAPVGETWKERLFEIAVRRASVFEGIMPYRLSANVRRFESAYLMQDYRRMLRLESEAVEMQLPKAVKADPVAVRMIGVVLSFQTWRLLRDDQDLPVDEAGTVVRRLLGAALAELPD